MTPEERDRMYALCMRIQDEKDTKKFNCLVEELERLLDTKRERIQASERQS
jgi:HPt (histidine-containing phosphotransfer) domain-containing protein